MEKRNLQEADLSSEITVEDFENNGLESGNETGETAAESETADGSPAELARALKESEEKASEYLNHLKRLQAEFDNYKKRVEKEKSEFIEYASANLISELIDVLENLERGVASAKESEDTGSVIKGMEIVYYSLKDILESYGLVSIKALGQKFDPYCHEAMMKTSSDKDPNNTVIEEFQRGYKLKNRVLRYSKVRVSVNEKNS